MMPSFMFAYQVLLKNLKHTQTELRFIGKTTDNKLLWQNKKHKLFLSKYS